ncbi:MAG: hypothetical protein KDB14_06370 [Planctomycetales bacterium]|nr:hypothetical protein [Planctomycetales bacterium]
MLKNFYLVTGVLVLSIYAASGLFGWELRGNGRRTFDKNQLRSSPGGIRGYHFWSHHHQGGK